jgi:hypothetical protein
LLALPTDTASRVILGSFAAVIIGLMAFVVWVGRFGEGQERVLAKTVMVREVSRSYAELRHCLSSYRLDGLMLSGRWYGDARSPDGAHGVNHASGLEVVIRDNGSRLAVTVTTPRGRQLWIDEKRQLDECLGRSAGTTG